MHSDDDWGCGNGGNGNITPHLINVLNIKIVIRDRHIRQISSVGFPVAFSRSVREDIELHWPTTTSGFYQLVIELDDFVVGGAQRSILEEMHEHFVRGVGPCAFRELCSFEFSPVGARKRTVVLIFGAARDQIGLRSEPGYVVIWIYVLEIVVEIAGFLNSFIKIDAILYHGQNGVGER